MEGNSVQALKVPYSTKHMSQPFMSKVADASTNTLKPCSYVFITINPLFYQIIANQTKFYDRRKGWLFSLNVSVICLP